MALHVKFCLFLVGILVCYCSVGGVYALASSLNVDQGLGTWSLALAYVTSLFVAPCTPVIGYLVGCKKLLLIAEVCYLLFVAGNCYASYYTLLPAGIFLGVSEALAWTATPIITTYFAEIRAREDSANKAKLIRYYTGYYFGVLQGAAVIGNGLSFAVLFIDRSLSGGQNTTDTEARLSNYTFCGAGDCQIPNITQANIAQYKPVYTSTRYALIGLYSFLLICAILFHAVGLPNDITWELPVTNHVETVAEETAIRTNQLPDNQLHPENAETEDLMSKTAPIINNIEQVSGGEVEKKTLKAGTKTFIKPKHLLIVLLPIYNGMTMSYSYGELTRAYASCMLGVDKVGVCIMLYAFADSVFSLLAGKVAGKMGRNFPFLFAFVLDLSIYTFSLLWKPNGGNLWFVYLIFIFLGCSDGVWQTLNTAMYGEYFPEERKLAYNLWNVITNIGLLVQFAISTSLCVYAKIYLQITVLCLAISLYGLSQVIYYPHELFLMTRRKSDCASE